MTKQPYPDWERFYSLQHWIDREEKRLSDEDNPQQIEKIIPLLQGLRCLQLTAFYGPKKFRPDMPPTTH